MQVATSAGGFHRDVLDEHVELAGLMIGLRDGVLDAAHLDLAGLVRLDDRVDAHLDALRLAGEDGYAAAREALRAGRPGSLFVVAVLAVEQRHDAHASQLAAVADANDTARRDLHTALGWARPRRAEAWALASAAHADPADREAALRARHLHRLPLGELAAGLTADPSPRRRALAYRALGDAAGPVDAALVEPGLHDADPAVRLAAGWAALRKARAPSAEALASIAAASPLLADPALELSARAAPGELEALLRSGVGAGRAEVRAVAAAGLPALLPRLFPLLSAPETARLAAFAYAMVTGCDLLAERLAARRPAPPGVGPSDDPRDERTDVPPEHHVPWPDRAAVEAHFARWSANLDPTVRHLGGSPLSPASLRAALLGAPQPVRAHAAAELALLDRREPLFRTRAPGFRQRARLAG